MLPLKLIYDEYLKNDYIVENNEFEEEKSKMDQFINIKNLLERDLKNKEYKVSSEKKKKYARTAYLNKKEKLEKEKQYQKCIEANI